MQHYAAFHQGMHCFLKLKQTSGTEKKHDLENYICDSLKYTHWTIPYLSDQNNYMGISIRIRRVNISDKKLAHSHVPLYSAFHWRTSVYLLRTLIP